MELGTCAPRMQPTSVSTKTTASRDGLRPSTIDAPITSLWTVMDAAWRTGHDPGGHCGMVSLVFERATLRKFLDWMAVDDRWMEKPIDWTLNDFVKAFGYQTDDASDGATYWKDT